MNERLSDDMAKAESHCPDAYLTNCLNNDPELAADIGETVDNTSEDLYLKLAVAAVCQAPQNLHQPSIVHVLYRASQDPVLKLVVNRMLDGITPQDFWPAVVAGHHAVQTPVTPVQPVHTVVTHVSQPPAGKLAAVAAQCRGDVFCTRERPQLAMMVHDFFLQGRLAMLFGEPGVGKSWLSLDLALAVASGTPWVQFPTTQYNVVYISREIPEVGLKDRTEKLLAARFGADAEAKQRCLESIWLFGEDSFDGSLLLPQDQDELAALLEVTGAQFLVLDTLSRIHQADENKASEMSPVLSVFDDLRRTFNCSILLIHHPNKEGGSRGTSKFDSDVQVFLHIKPTHNKKYERELAFKKVNLGATPDPVTFTQHPGTGLLFPGGVKEYIHSIVKLYPGSTKEDLAQHTGMPVKTLENHLPTMETAGEIQSTGKPKRYMVE